MGPPDSRRREGDKEVPDIPSRLGAGGGEEAWGKWEIFPLETMLPEKKRAAVLKSTKTKNFYR